MQDIFHTIGVCFLWSFKIYLGLAVLRAFELYGSGWEWKQIFIRFDNRVLFTDLTKEQYNEAFTIQEVE